MGMVIKLSDRVAARVSAVAAARGVTETEVIEDLVMGAPGPAPIVLDDTEDPLESFFGCGDSGDPDWAGTDTRLLRNPAR
jgi:hypothetical protein